MSKTQIAIWATPEEVANIELIKKHYLRSSAADTLRYLITSEAEKILSKNISNEIKDFITPSNQAAG